MTKIINIMGFIVTPLVRLKQTKSNTLTRQVSTPEDVAALIVFLGLPVNRQIAGEIIRINGGR